MELWSVAPAELTAKLKELRYGLVARTGKWVYVELLDGEADEMRKSVTSTLRGIQSCGSNGTFLWAVFSPTLMRDMVSLVNSPKDLDEELLQFKRLVQEVLGRRCVLIYSHYG